MEDKYNLWLIFLHLEINTLVLPFSRSFKLEFLIQDLISRLIVNENEISVFQNLILDVANKK